MFFEDRRSYYIQYMYYLLYIQQNKATTRTHKNEQTTRETNRPFYRSWQPPNSKHLLLQYSSSSSSHALPFLSSFVLSAFEISGKEKRERGQKISPGSYVINRHSRGGREHKKRTDGDGLWKRYLSLLAHGESFLFPISFPPSLPFDRLVAPRGERRDSLRINSSIFYAPGQTGRTRFDRGVHGGKRISKISSLSLFKSYREGSFMRFLGAYIHGSVSTLSSTVSWRLFFDFMPKADDESGDWDFTLEQSEKSPLAYYLKCSWNNRSHLFGERERQKENFDVLTVNQNHSRCKTLILLLRAYFKWELNQMQARTAYSCICLVNPFGFNSWNWTKSDASLDLL